MVFNSISFLVFFTTFFLLYWFVFNKSLKLQNLLILIASYIFYAWADWRFLAFLIAVSSLNFYLGMSIEKTTDPKHKRLLRYVGLIQGIGGLAFFKYYNFFIDSFNDAFQLLGVHLGLQTLNIIIPLGISFFTFRTISYILDVDKGKIKASSDWIVFFSYVAFFPSLLSGPIDKAITFIPQLEKKRIFDYNLATNGLRQIVWGLFKKIVIADNCATITSQIFDNYLGLPASTLLLGAFIYTVQIYADFSGYSDMAIGFSRLLGFNISKNFDFPFFAQNIAEFWRKWHISLTSWLTEYVFTPLCITFRDYEKIGLILAIVINFTICGIWHGANWTYVLFGFLHGCYFIPLILKGTMHKKKKLVKGKLLPSLKEFVNIVLTFTLIMLTFIIFRSETIGQAYHYYFQLFSFSLFSSPGPLFTTLSTLTTLSFIILMFVIEWMQRDKDYGFQIDSLKNPLLKFFIYYALVLAIILCGTDAPSQFIYVQF